jgi:hypothetical protein
MKKYFGACWLCILAAAAAVVIILSVTPSLSPLQNLCLAMVLGGLAGGFTLALIGGESYGLKMPGVYGAHKQGKVDPGFFGDVFVGLMAAGLGIGLGTWAEIFKTSPFDAPTEPAKFASRWVADFAIAYVCGFLGLRLIKTVSMRVLKEAELEENLKKTEQNEVDNLYSRAQEAVRNGQYDIAANMFHSVQELEGQNSIRALIGLARCEKRMGRYGDAVASLDRAIAQSPNEKEAYRLPVAYWNRGCYKTLAYKDNLAPHLADIVNDLKEAIRLQGSFKVDLRTDEDLKVLQGEPIFEELAKAQ